MSQIGVIEGFFGPQWSVESRKSYAEFLSRYGGDFYIYAPKQDQNLRKKWRMDWSQSYQNELISLAQTFQSNSIKFGIGFSPFGLGVELSREDREHLTQKINLLNQLGIDLLGLFFDDMPTNENLAKTQIEVLSLIKDMFKGRIIFCPSYYTPDPILDKVFGKRPEKYLEEIAQGIPSDVAIAWTGPKVISLELSNSHLMETAQMLKRKPFLWENLYANDGPKNCKFLKLRPFEGRSKESLRLVEGFGFNMLNQPELSKILFLSSKFVFDGKDPAHALDLAVETLCSKDFGAFLKSHKDLFLNIGLDSIPEGDKEGLKNSLKEFPDLPAREVSDWLNGVYLVGSECLTD